MCNKLQHHIYDVYENKTQEIKCYNIDYGALNLFKKEKNIYQVTDGIKHNIVYRKPAQTQMFNIT